MKTRRIAWSALGRLIAAALLLLDSGCSVVLPFGGGSGSDQTVADAGDLAQPADGGADLTQTDASPGWLAGWSYRKGITLALPQEDLKDFPVLVSFPSGDADLALHAAADGHDLVFTSSDGTSRLPHEIEAPVGTDGKLVAWVKVPLVSSSTLTRIFLYYGTKNAADQATPDQVWTNGFIAVWHFHTAPPTLTDSTAGGNHGSTENMAPASVVPGQIGGGYHFDGVTQRVVASQKAVRPAGAFQISTWFRVDAGDKAWSDDVLVGVMGDQFGVRGWDLSFDADSDQANTCRYVVFRSSPDGMNVPEVGWGEACPGDWHHAVGAFEPGKQLRFHIDGAAPQVKPITATTQHVPAGVPLVIAAENGGPDQAFTGGEIDEMRLEVPRAPAWIAACFANQSDPRTFLTVGPEERAP